MVSSAWRMSVSGAGAAVLLLAACSSPSTSRAPVEDRQGDIADHKVIMDPQTQAVTQPPGFEHAGKPGYYTVKPGETLFRVGLETGQHWKDIQRWNKLGDPDQIQVGQVLRIHPPLEAGDGPAIAPAKRAEPPAVAVAAATPVRKPALTAQDKPEPATAVSPKTKPVPPVPSAAPEPARSDSQWIWPVSGPVLSGFDEAKNKGLDLGGTLGDPVVAAGDGRVVYAGAGLRGYGNLIILKHDSTYLTAYAHNRSLLVKEDQAVRKGQKIAEMGSSDADRVKLHFEIRRQGKPVDPAKYLPAR